MNGKSLSVKTKLLGFIGGFFSLVILIITMFSFFNFKSSSVENNERNLGDKAFLIANSVEQKMLRYFDGLNIISSALPIDEQGQITDLEQLKKTIGDAEKQLNVLAVYVGLESGLTYLPKGEIPNFNAKDLNREWYNRLFAGEKNIITTPYTSSAGNLVMALGVPVMRGGKVVATLAGNIPVAAISEFIEGMSGDSQVYASRSDGFILASHKNEDVGQNLFTIYPSFSGFKNDNGHANRYFDQDREKSVVNYGIDSSGWTIWAWDYQADIEAKSNENLLQSSVTAAVLIAISLIAAYYLITNLMYKPIGGEPKDIENLVQRVAEGNLQVSSKLTGAETGVYKTTMSMVEDLRAMVKQIDSSTNDLNGISVQVRDSSDGVNTSSESQMHQLEQTATAMNEMTVTVDEVARSALNASEAAQDAADQSRSGIDLVNAMNNDVSDLVSSIEMVVEVNKNLEEQTQRINGILEVINGISEQTNLLALNAAIEAARAGEHGRGFAVVADEVRSLANRTKSSTSEIQEMISDLQTEAAKSLDLMNKNFEIAQLTSDKSQSANDALRKITDSVSVITDMNNQIATAAEQQTHVAAEINNNVVDINDLAKVTFEHANTNKLVVDQLANLTVSMQEIVGKFKL